MYIEVSKDKKNKIYFEIAFKIEIIYLFLYDLPITDFFRLLNF